MTSKRSTTRKKEQPEHLIHVEEYLLTRDDVMEEVKAGFRIFVRGKAYQYGKAEFDKLFDEYFKREI